MRFPPAAGVLVAGCMATAAAQSDRAIDLSSGVPFHLVEPTAPFPVTYEVGGATHSLEEYFERNFVTGFLVLRDSAIWSSVTFTTHARAGSRTRRRKRRAKEPRR